MDIRIRASFTCQDSLWKVIRNDGRFTVVIRGWMTIVNQRADEVLVIVVRFGNQEEIMFGSQR